MLRWAAFPSDYRLEANPTIGLGFWKPFPCTVALSNGFCYVFVPANDAANYFRLVNTPPTLEVLGSTLGKLTLRWPTLPSGFVLESTANLNPSSWTTVASPPMTTNSLNHVEVNTTRPSRATRIIPAVRLAEEAPRLRPLRVAPADLALRIPLTVGPTGYVLHDTHPYSMSPDALVQPVGDRCCHWPPAFEKMRPLLSA